MNAIELRAPGSRVRLFRLLAPSPVCPRCGMEKWGSPAFRHATRVRRCEGRRRWLWGLVGPRVCPTQRAHMHASCEACGAEWLEAAPEQPEPGESR
jgi:hypothetical protein